MLPEVLYKLYLISKEIKETDAARYAQRLKDEFPNSTFAKILLNPDYLKETSVAAEKQKIIYKEAYTFYQNNNLRAAQDKITTALQVGETGFSPQILLLKILILGRTEDIAKYQYELGEFIKKYHDEPIRPYAEQLLASSKLLLEKLEKAKGITFGTSLKGPHLFVVIYDEKNRITNQVDNALDNFGSTLWKNLKLTSANLSFGETQTLTMISEFPDRQTALSYYDKFLAQMTTSKPFSNYKFYNFVISKDNFQIFYRTKSLDEYLTFFDRYYQKQNP